MTEQIKKVGAPVANQNAKKPITAESFLHIRCKTVDKAKWVKSAQGAGGLSVWVTEMLNAASAGNN